MNDEKLVNNNKKESSDEVDIIKIGISH